MLSISNEVRLVLTLTIGGEEVPADLKQAALEELRILAMHFGDGTAELYLLEMIIEAVENEDAEALVKAGDLVRKVLGNDIVGSYDNVNDLSRIAFNACEKFIEDEDSQVRRSVTAKLTEEGVMPMYYEKGFMVLYHVEYGILILASVNNAHDDRRVLKNLFENMPERTGLLNKIRKLTGSPDFEIHFGTLEYELLEGGHISMTLEEM